jgi:sugar phosphate isomerase/epimerase
VKIGVYTAVLHDRDLRAALATTRELGLEGVEVNAGGFVGTPHLPVDAVLSSDTARDEYLGLFDDAGMALSGLNCNGNPLHVNPAIRAKHASDLVRSITLAERLGQHRVVCMSGLPGGAPGASAPTWIVNPWDSTWLDALEAQWEVAVPFWRELDRRAADADVHLCIEMHPQNLVFNPSTLERLVERTGATHVGAEMDPSHLFWQQIDPVAAIRHLGPLVRHAAAKDVRVNPAAAIHGVLDDRFRRLRPDEERVQIGTGEGTEGSAWVNEWPQDSAWDFVAVGNGHAAAFWAEFLRALHEVDPDMAVNIEHEDTSLSRIEGLRVAAATLAEARAAAGV